MKIKHILTLIAVIVSLNVWGQSTYNLNYPDIKIGNKPDGGKIVLNGSNLQFPRIGLGSSTDSVLTIVNGVVKKTPNNYIRLNPSNQQIGEINIKGLVTFQDDDGGHGLNLLNSQANQNIEFWNTGIGVMVSRGNHNTNTGYVAFNGGKIVLSEKPVIDASPKQILTRDSLTGEVKYINPSSIIPNLQQVTDAGFTTTNPISVGAISAGSGSITSAPTQPTNIVRKLDLDTKANLAGGNIFTGTQVINGQLIAYNEGTKIIHEPLGFEVHDSNFSDTYFSTLSPTSLRFVGDTPGIGFRLTVPVLTGDRDQVFQNKSGTIALKTDITEAVANETLQTITNRGSSTTTGASFMGDVGIGLNTTPLQTLHVRTNNSLSNARGLLIENSSTGATGFQIGNSIIPTNKKWQIFVKDENNTGNPDNYTFTIGQDNVADYLTVKSVSGNIGVGNQNPTAKFDVNGSARASANDGNANTLVRNTDLKFRPTSLKTANYTITTADYTIRADASGAARTITLPTAASVSGQLFNVKKSDSSVNTVTIQANGAETIDGTNTKIITSQYGTITIQSNGTSWDVIL